MPCKEFHRLLTIKEMNKNRRHIDFIISKLLDNELRDITAYADENAKSYIKILLLDTGILIPEESTINIFTEDEGLNTIFGAIAGYIEQANAITSLEPLYKMLSTVNCGFRFTKQAALFFTAVVLSVYKEYVIVYKKSVAEILQNDLKNLPHVSKFGEHLTAKLLHRIIKKPQNFFIECIGISEASYLYSLYEIFVGKINPDRPFSFYDIYDKIIKWYKALPTYSKISDIIYNGYGKEHFKINTLYNEIRMWLKHKGTHHIEFLLKDLSNILHDYYNDTIELKDTAAELKYFKLYLENLYPNLIHRVILDLNINKNNEKELLMKYLEYFSEKPLNRLEKSFIAYITASIDDDLITMIEEISNTP